MILSSERTCVRDGGSLMTQLEYVQRRSSISGGTFSKLPRARGSMYMTNQAAASGQELVVNAKWKGR